MEVDIFWPCEREVQCGLNLETKVQLVRIFVFLREDACLPHQDFGVDVEDARVFFNIHERAAKDTRVVPEERDIDPNLEN